jgi:chaperonin GroES
MFKPLGQNVIIERIKEEQKSKSGLIIVSADKNKERNDFGTIVAVADGIEDMKNGDSVLFSKYAGTVFKENDTEYLIINRDDILAVRVD